MNTEQFVYLIFGIVLVLALVFDLGLISKRNQSMSIKQALVQTVFWVALAMAFFAFLWVEAGSKRGLEYLSAYLMEWSLSIDNIFVFILIFNSFKVKEQNYSRVLLIGILMAIVFRVIFITIGVALVAEFHWLLYGFGLFLLYTGYKMFTTNEEDTFEPHDSKVYKFVKKYLPLASHDGHGKFLIRENGKPVYTTLFVVVILLASIDLVFALDSIPAVLGISKEKIVIYTSNIFAVLGLRSLFFLLRGAVNKFDYLQQGIAVVLVFIGLKMLGENWIDQWMDKTMQTIISLLVILVCLSTSIIYSYYHDKKGIIKTLNN
ncbi:MAG: TerC/Alx family metal homeostasis membrane protein [Chitinophagaceae bacterium]|nr:TerC/Alx family metal homeostasis membrane protein [Chitinophagaceae bacterium]